MAPAGKRSVAAALLVVFPLVLPFEAPLFRVGPLAITSVELALYLTLGAWAASVTSLGRVRDLVRAPLARAVVTWMLVVAASALAAPSHRAETLKLALRATGGALLFFAARDLAREPAVARRVLLAIVAGAVLSAACAIVELAVPQSAALWRPFRAQAFTALGVPRASGAFAYPTMAAMYWEASLPLCAVVLARGRLLAAGALSAVLVAAILASATRAAVAGALLALVALALLEKRARAAAAVMLAVTSILVAIGLLGPTSLIGQRLRWWSTEAWYAASYTLDQPRLTLPAGAQAGVGVTVTNRGALAWPHAGNDAVHLSHHWERDGGIVQFEGQRTRLPHDLAPGASARLVAAVMAPAAPGSYRLRWDLVRETVTWFSARGVATGDQLVDVVSGGAAPPPPRAGSLEELFPVPPPSRPELWRAAVELWRRHPFLGVGPDNFRHRYPEVLTAPRFADERLHANSLYLETLADLGLAGVAALAFLLVALLRGARRSDLVCLAGAGTFLVHGLVDTFFAFTPLYGLWWLLLGLAAPRDSSPTAPAR